MDEPKGGGKKSKTSKSRRETAVQGTNDSSIVSKCSMAAQGYFSDHFLQGFVSKVTRRAPLIHRGYYVRAKTLDFVLKKFLEMNKGQKQIVSLGAGFDSAFFRLQSQSLLEDTVFFEVDFPEVVQRKSALIQDNAEMAQLVGECNRGKASKSPHIQMASRNYQLLGVDLAQTNTLEAALKVCDVDFDTPTLLMSECVLTYMTRRCASSVVRWAAETFCNSVFVLYEQINPDDAFGLFMQHHFHTVGSPLKSINSFPSIQSQKDRFTKLGWTNVEALDMNQFYYGLLSSAEHIRVENLEAFDEYEEWHLKCAHYMVLCGYGGNCKPVLSSVDTEIDVVRQAIMKSSNEFSGVIHFTHPSGEFLQFRRFGHGSAQLGPDTKGCSRVVCVGGFGEQKGKHMRVTDVTLVDPVTFQCQIVDPGVDNRNIEVSRMHPSVSSLRNGTVILIGGRLSPMKLCTQVVCIKMHDGTSSRNNEFKFNGGESVLGKGSATEVVNKGVMNCEMVEENMNIESEGNMNCGNEVSNRQARNIFDACTNCDKNNCNEIEKANVSVDISDLCENISVLSNNEGEFDEREIKNCDTGVNRQCVVAERSVSENRDSIKGNNSAGNGASAGWLSECEGRSSNCVSFGVTCNVMEQLGEVPSPRWRHTAVVYEEEGEEKVLVYGGRTQVTLTLGDCYTFTTRSGCWKKCTTSGSAPIARQSHSAVMWRDNMVIAGGLKEDLTPLNCIHLLNVQTATWQQLHAPILPRYSHTAHVIGDCLVLVGGVNFSHSPPGVAVVHLPSGNYAEFPLPEVDKDRLVMLHRHTSVVLDNRRILLLGGGGNCFSFGTHLNSSPIILELGEAIQMVERMGVDSH